MKMNFKKFVNTILSGANDIEQHTGIRHNKMKIYLNEYTGKLFLDYVIENNSSYKLEHFNKNEKIYSLGAVVGIQVFVNKDFINNYGPFIVMDYEYQNETKHKVLIDTKIED